MMTTGLQLALLGGLCLGAGIAALVWRLVPAQPDALDVAVRMAPGTRTSVSATAVDATAGGVPERLGRWGMKTLPARVWGTVPSQQLALLRMSLVRFYGEKLTFALLGLMIPPLLSSLALIAGVTVPVVLPVAAGLALAGVMFFIPDYNVRDDAAKARTEFTRALSAYVELVALERNAGSGTRQAMEAAARVGDSWVFARLGEELAFSRWTGEAPWDALNRLAAEVGVVELSDVADILRLSGEEGSQVYTQLRARAASMRAALQNQELAHANAVGEKLTMPMSALGIVFLTILIVPALLRVVGIS